MQGYLPRALPGGFALSSTSNASGAGASQAEGVYQNGEARLTLTVVDMGAMGALAAVAGAAGIQQSRQDADGYARTNTVDGRVISEEVSQSAGTVSYSVTGRGIVVTAQGSGGVTIEQARAAVEAVGVQRLEQQAGN